MLLRHDRLDRVHLAVVFDERGEMLAVYARPDDARAWLGDIFAAQVTRYAPAQRAYFLDLGSAAGEGFLPHSENGVLRPGQHILVRVERPATRSKKIRCALIAAETGHAPARLETGLDIIAQAQQDYPALAVQDDGLADYDAALYGLLQPVVPVQRGIELVIEPVTALTAVDVNNADPDLSPLEVNRLAARALARAMRLRNLGGQILVDFLRMRDAKHRAALENSLSQLAVGDPCALRLYGYTRLGLYEMVRGKRGLPLAEIFALAASS